LFEKGVLPSLQQQGRGEGGRTIRQRGGRKKRGRDLSRGKKGAIVLQESANGEGGLSSGERNVEKIIRKVIQSSTFGGGEKLRKGGGVDSKIFLYKKG